MDKVLLLRNTSFITSFRSKIGSCNYPSSTCISCAHIAMDTLDRCGANIITLTVPLALDQFIFSVNIGSKDINASIARTTDSRHVRTKDWIPRELIFKSLA